jgi:hypothetical protein
LLLLLFLLKHGLLRLTLVLALALLLPPEAPGGCCLPAAA